MSKKEKDVELIPDTSKSSGWKIKHDGKEGDNPNQGGPNPYPKVKFDEDSGPHLIVFTLPKNGTAKFNSADPMWIQKTDPANPTSPTQAGMDPQFPDWALFDGDKTLVVLDKNTEKAVYSYRVKADGYDPPLDPIVDNGGGSPGIEVPPPGDGGRFAPGDGGAENMFANINILLIGATLVALIAGFVIGRFWR